MFQTITSVATRLPLFQAGQERAGSAKGKPNTTKQNLGKTLYQLRKVTRKPRDQEGLDNF